MQGCKSVAGQTSETWRTVHKSAAAAAAAAGAVWFVYLIKYHFIEMHGAWWGSHLSGLACSGGGVGRGPQIGVGGVVQTWR